MSRLDFSGLRDELVLQNLPTRAHPEGKTYIVRDPSTEDVERLLEIDEQINDSNRRLLEASVEDVPDDETDEARDAREARLKAAEDAVKAAGAAMTEFLTVDGKEVPLLRRLLGDSLDEIEADGLGKTSYDRLQESILDTLTGGLDYAQRNLARMAAGEAEARANRATRRAAAKESKRSSRPATSKSSRARTSAATARTSSGTPARTTGRASTPSSKTSAPSKAPARKAG